MKESRSGDVFNVGDLVYSPVYGRGFVTVVRGDRDTGYLVVAFDHMDRGIPYLQDGSCYGRDHPSPVDIAIEAEWREIEEESQGGNRE